MYSWRTQTWAPTPNVAAWPLLKSLFGFLMPRGNGRGDETRHDNTSVRPNDNTSPPNKNQGRIKATRKNTSIHSSSKPSFKSFLKVCLCVFPKTGRPPASDTPSVFLVPGNPPKTRLNGRRSCSEKGEEKRIFTSLQGTHEEYKVIHQTSATRRLCIRYIC